MKALAAVATEIGSVRWQEVETPEPGSDDVVVRVTHSWISNGTEGSFIRGERIAGDTPRKDSDALPFPHIPGYQKVGIVEQVGAAVTEFAPGDSVFATVSKVEGMFYPYAGHISPAVTHRSQVWKLPSDLNPVAASGLVLTQVGYNVGIRPTLSTGDAAVVLGDGMVGHWSAQTLQWRGARVLLVGHHSDRLERFVPRDRDRVVNLRETNIVDAVKEFAPEGVHIVADTVGSMDSVRSLFPLMRHGGQISSAGFYGPNGLIDIQEMRNKELSLHTPAGWAKDRMDATLNLIVQGHMTTLPLITHYFPAWECSAAYEAVLSRVPGLLGVILEWEGVE